MFSKLTLKKMFTCVLLVVPDMLVGGKSALIYVSSVLYEQYTNHTQPYR